MIKTGVVSVTFRQKSPREIVALSKKAGIDSIEWGSDVHVPQGDLKIAREVLDMTVSEGLEIASYGSYYRLGSGEAFEPFLESAVALGAPNIRVWAGSVASSKATDEDWSRITEDAARISELSKKAKVTVSTEYHANTLTDTCDCALKLISNTASQNFYTYWQPPLDVKEEDQLPCLERVMASDKLTNIHVYQITPEYEHLPLETGRARWTAFFKTLKKSKADRYALIEFVLDNSDEMFLADCAVLSELI